MLNNTVFSSRNAVARNSQLGALLFVMSSAAAAQQQDNASAAKRSDVIEEVIVSARRVDESLQKAPVSITAFSESDLQQIGASEPKDIAQLTPNLTIRNAPGTNDDYAFSLRGVAAAEPSLAIDPAVGLYIDGIYIARNAGMAFDVVNMKRIEVLRGPQGTLFGRNTIGGAVNIITTRPTGEFGYTVELGAGNNDNHRAKVAVDLPAWGDWSASLAFFDKRQGGWVDSVYGGELGGQMGTAWRGALHWEASETLSADYTYTLTDRAGNGQISQITHVRPIYADPNGQFYGGPFYEQAAAAASAKRLDSLPIENSRSRENTSRIDAHTLTLDWELNNNLQLRSISSYRDWDDSGIPEFSSFRVESTGDVIDVRGLTTGDPVRVVPAGEMVPLFRSPRFRDQQQATQEFQFIGTAFDERLQYTTGVYFFHEKGFEDSTEQTLVLPTSVVASLAADSFGLPPIITAINSLPASQTAASAALLVVPFEYEIENEAYALYGDYTWHFTSDLAVSIGARYSVDERAVNLQNTFGEDAFVIRVADEWSNFSPGITLTYQWSEEVNSYAKIATGYRSGGFNIRASTDSAFRTPFDPETLTSYEVGIKSELLDRRLRLNVAVFRFVYQDRQIAEFEAGSGGASSQIVNAGESQTTGLEIDSVYIPAPGWRLLANYGFLDVDYKEFVTGPLDPVTGYPSAPGNQDISGEADTRLFAPRHTGSLAVEYQFTPWSFGQLNLRTDVSYTGEVAFHPQLSLYDTSEEHTIVNARATLADIRAGGGSLEFSLWGRNLTGKEYRDFGIDFGILGFTIDNFAPLRSYGADLVYRFGG